MTARRAIQSNVISSAGQALALDDDDDDFLNEIDMDQITSVVAQNPIAPVAAAAAAASSNQTNNCPPVRRQSTLLFDDFDDFDLLNVDSIIEQQNTNAPTSQQSGGSSSKHNENIQLNTSTDEVLPIYDEKYRFKIRGINLATVRQLHECDRQHLLRRKHFLVKATVDAIVQKARVSKGKWVLNVKITDPLSQDITVETAFHATVTEKIAGRSGREVSQLNKERTEKPQNQHEITAILENLTNQLEDLNAFLKLEYSCDADHPTVVEIINAAPVLDRKLQEKISFEQLR